MSGMADSLMGDIDKNKEFDQNKIHSNNIMTEMMSTIINGISANNLEAFKSHIEN